MRFVTAAVILLLSLISCAPAKPHLRTVPEQRSTAVAIFTTCPGGSGYGSGVLLDGRRVLTAAHVTGCGLPLLRVTTRAGDVRLMKVVAIDHAIDLAILEVDDGELRFPYPVPSVSIGNRPSVGDVVCMESGEPGRRRQCGEVLDFRADELPGNMKHGGLTIPGNSGSGVYDEAGRLVAVVTHWFPCDGFPCGGLASTLDGDRLRKLLDAASAAG